MNLTQLKIDNDLFVNKVKEDLTVGVEINSSNQEETKLVKVWTDSEGWEFLIVGLLRDKDVSTLFAIEIEAQGKSKDFIKMTCDLSDEANPIINFEKLANEFAKIEEVAMEEADEFIGAYLNSTFNRTKTEELFNELANDQNYFSWLMY